MTTTRTVETTADAHESQLLAVQEAPPIDELLGLPHDQFMQAVQKMAELGQFAELEKLEAAMRVELERQVQINRFLIGPTGTPNGKVH